MTGQLREQSKASGPCTGPVQTGGGTDTSTDTLLESGLAAHADSRGCLGAGTCPPHSQTATCSPGGGGGGVGATCCENSP